MALVADQGLVGGGVGTSGCIMNTVAKSPLIEVGDSVDDHWRELFLDSCLDVNDVPMDTSGAQIHLLKANSAARGNGPHGNGSSSDSGREESNEGAGLNQSATGQPLSANSGNPIVMPGEGVGSGNPNSSPRKRQMKRQPSNLSDKSSGKGSGKGSGKTSMEGSGEGPVKSSHAEGMFPGLQQFGNGSMGMLDSMGEGTDELSMFLKNLSWFWRSEDMGCRLFAVQQFQAWPLFSAVDVCLRYSCNREHAGLIAQTSGALRYLVYILQQNYLAVNDPSKAAAAYALQNLAYHSSATRERISQAGAIPVLVQLLQSSDDTVREASAGCLANLAMEPAILDDIVQKDGVPFMLQLLRGSPGCLEEGLCFLFLFASKSYDNQVRLARYGIMQCLVHLLSTPLSPRAKRLIGLFWSLFLPSSDLLVQHEFTKVIPLLIQLVQAGPPDAQDAAAVLLADYCKQDDDNARLFRKLGGVVAFCNLYKSRPNNHPAWHRIVDLLMTLGVDIFHDDVNQAAASGTGFGNICTRTASTTSLNGHKVGASATTHTNHNSFSRTCSMNAAPSPSSSSNPVSMGHMQAHPSPSFHVGPPPGMVLMQPPPPSAHAHNMAMMHPGIMPVPQPGMVSVAPPGMVPVAQAAHLPQQPGMVPVPQPGMMALPQAGMMPIPQQGMVPIPQPGMVPLTQPGMISVAQGVPQPGMPIPMMHFPGKSAPGSTDGPLSGQSGPPSITGPINVAMQHLL